MGHESGPTSPNFHRQNVKDYETAEAFLSLVARFQRHAAAHNCSAEGNPSGGNMYRGLYNIALKSLGAATNPGHTRWARALSAAAPPHATQEAQRAWRGACSAA